MKRREFVENLAGGAALWLTRPEGSTADPLPSGKLEGKPSPEAGVGTPRELRRRIAGLRQDLARLDKSLATARQAHIPVPYQQVTAAVTRVFLPWQEDDLRQGMLERAWRNQVALEAMTVKAWRDTKAALADPARAMDCPLYAGGPIAVREGGFWGERIWSGSQRRDSGPLFLVGYGYWGQVRRDISNFPALGLHIAQLGRLHPRDVFPAPGKTNRRPFFEINPVLDEAKTGGVQVDLIDGMNLPGWLYRQHPNLLDGYGEYIPFDIDSPRSRQLRRKFLQLLLHTLGPHRRPFAYCLANEPDYRESGNSPYSRRLWRRWLRQQHGDIATLNGVYGTSFTNFRQVPIPTLGNEGRYPAPLFYDWSIFNQQRFAAWCRWQGSVIHAVDPAVHLHVKINATYSPLSPIHVGWGIDPELLSTIGDIAGNDGGTEYAAHGAWAEPGAGSQFLWYDILYSLSGNPLYNSENHLVPNNSTAPIPPEHVRTMLWQGAVHGLSATTLWLWERNPGWSFGTENISNRADLVEAVSHTSLDEMRLSQELRALQQAPRQIALLYSIPSFVYAARQYFNSLDYPGVYMMGPIGPGWKSPVRYCEYYGALVANYEALLFSGERTAFISEKQIAENMLSGLRILIVPCATHVKADTLSAIQRFVENGGLVALYGGDACLRADEYGRPLSGRDGLLRHPRVVSWDGSLRHAALRNQILAVLRRSGVQPPLHVSEEDKEDLPWGVEWRSVSHEGRILLNLANYTHASKRLRLHADKLHPPMVDLLTQEDLGPSFELAPLQVRLISCRI